MPLVVAIADYAASFPIESDSALKMARRCLIDALAGGFEALLDPECASLISPLVPGALMPGGARVPGTSLELDPAQAAFCLGVMLCRAPDGDHGLKLPYGGTNASLAALLATADYRARKATMEGQSPPSVRDVLAATVKALEIQGVLARASGEPRAWTATVRFARVAATAVAAAQLGGSREEIVNALSYAALEGSGLPIDGDAPSDTARRDWATADAISRAVRHACQATAASRAHPVLALELNSVALAGRFLGSRLATAGPAFGTEVIDRLAKRDNRQEATRHGARFQSAVERSFPARQAERIKALFAAPERLDELPVNELFAALVRNGAR